MVTLNRLPESERNKTNSRQMRAFMQALLEVSGLAAGQDFNLKAMLGNFKTHLDNGRFESTLRGGEVRLTEVGREYFSHRLTSGKVSREEVIEMIRNIISIDPPINWEPVEVDVAKST